MSLPNKVEPSLPDPRRALQWFGQDAWLNFPRGLDAWLEADGFTSSARSAAYFLRCFDTELDAAEAYDNGARELFGEHAT